MIVEDGTGWTVKFASAANQATATNDKTGESARTGTVSGGFVSPTDLSLKIVYPEGTQVYSGTVGEDGFARGVTAQAPFDGIHWQSQSPLLCVETTGSPPPQQAPPPEQQAPPPAQAPTNAITVNIVDVTGGLKVTVNNSSDVAGTCTYDATAPNSPIPPTHRNFMVGAKAGTDFQINGIRTGTTFNTVTACRGTFQGKDVEIGRVEIAKTF